jgi:hypothetical protein
MSDDETQRFAERLREVPLVWLEAELAARGFRMTRRADEASSHEVDISNAVRVQLSHLADDVLAAVVEQRGVTITARPPTGDNARSENVSIDQALDDTYTREELNEAYQRMLEMRKRRKSQPSGD